jgi:hypothetical protein
MDPTISPAGVQAINAVFLQDDYLYFNAGSNLAILDVSDRQAPRLLGSVKLPVETIFNLFVTDGITTLVLRNEEVRNGYIYFTSLARM